MMENDMGNMGNTIEFKAKAIELMAAPVDPKTFIYAVDVFNATARMLMPDISTTDLPLEVASAVNLFARDDGSFNRAMHAVAKDLVEMKVENPTAYVVRIAMLPDLYGAAGAVFHEYINEDPSEPGMIAIDPPLMKAAAVAEVAVDTEGIGFNLADVLAHARSFSSASAVSE